MTASALVVTGATGRVGGPVAATLQSAGIDQRLLVRDPARLPARLQELSTEVASYGHYEAVRQALRGARVVLMVSATEAVDRLEQHRTFVDAAATAGVEHLVYTSFVGASPESTFLLGRDHASTEAHIEASGMRHTFLRDNLYLDFLPLLAGQDGVIRGPAGRGRVAAVAQEDVASVASAVLSDLGPHVNAAYELTGPQALTLDEAAATIREVTGREVTYHDERVDEAYASRADLGAEPWQLDAWVSTYTAIAAGELAAVSDHVERILGRPPLGLAEVLRHG